MPSQFHKGGKWIRSDRRLGIYLRDSFGCIWCQMDLTQCHPNIVTLDHLLPREQLGGNESTNLVTSCKACNVKRGTQTVNEFARALGVESFPESPSAARSFARDIIARVRRQRAAEPNLKLARAILAGVASDPRPIVVAARKAGKSLAPRNSAGAKLMLAKLRRERRGSCSSMNKTGASDATNAPVRTSA